MTSTNYNTEMQHIMSELSYAYAVKKIAFYNCELNALEKAKLETLLTENGYIKSCEVGKITIFLLR